MKRNTEKSINWRRKRTNWYCKSIRHPRRPLQCAILIKECYVYVCQDAPDEQYYVAWKIRFRRARKKAITKTHTYTNVTYKCDFVSLFLLHLSPIDFHTLHCYYFVQNTGTKQSVIHTRFFFFSHVQFHNKPL